MNVTLNCLSKCGDRVFLHKPPCSRRPPRKTCVIHMCSLLFLGYNCIQHLLPECLQATVAQQVCASKQVHFHTSCHVTTALVPATAIFREGWMRYDLHTSESSARRKGRGGTRSPSQSTAKPRFLRTCCVYTFGKYTGMKAKSAV